MKRIAKRIEIKGKTYFTKLKIDHRTVVTVRNLESFMVWKAKFPQAVEVF